MEEITRGMMEEYRLAAVQIEQGVNYGDRFKFTLLLIHPKAPGLTIHSSIGPGWGVLTISYPNETGIMLREHTRRALYDRLDPVIKLIGKKMNGFAGLGSIT
jgi:hypothetical protein